MKVISAVMDSCATRNYCYNRICHWGPLITISIIFHVSICGLYVISMWWPPVLSDWSSCLHLFIYLSWIFAILFNYMNGLLLGPGFVPLRWLPTIIEDKQFLQWCCICSGYKPPRAHHCHKCDRCVLKMDHHCPWINTCCGHRNHTFFVQFLLFAPLGCSHAATVLAIGLYRVMYIGYYAETLESHDTLIYMGLFELLACFVAFGLALGVIIAVGALFFIQLRGMLRNETQIESWIKEKAYFRTRDPNQEEDDFHYPYNLGSWAANLWQVCTWNGYSRGDGYEWPLAVGAGRFDLTVEQMCQKREKILLSRKMRIVRDFNGSIFPLSFGLLVCLQPPCSDERRLAVRSGQVLRVTRWRSHWLYGQVIKDTSGTQLDEAQPTVHRLRGWFPKCCAAEFDYADDSDNEHMQVRRVDRLLQKMTATAEDFGTAAMRSSDSINSNNVRLRATAANRGADSCSAALSNAHNKN